MRTSGWMKRQPWFWPVKRFIKRIGRKLGYRIFAISETGRELGFVLSADAGTA